MPKEFLCNPVKIGSEIFSNLTITVSLRRSVTVRMWIALKLIWLASKVLGSKYEEEEEICQK